MTTKQMRDAIKKAPKYENALAWHARVDAMGDKQVMAIYFRMKRAKEI